MAQPPSSWAHGKSGSIAEQTIATTAYSVGSSFYNEYGDRFAAITVKSDQDYTLYTWGSSAAFTSAGGSAPTTGVLLSTQTGTATSLDGTMHWVPIATARHVLPVVYQSSGSDAAVTISWATFNDLGGLPGGVDSDGTMNVNVISGTSTVHEYQDGAAIASAYATLLAASDGTYAQFLQTDGYGNLIVLPYDKNHRFSGYHAESAEAHTDTEVIAASGSLTPMITDIVFSTDTDATTLKIEADTASAKTQLMPVMQFKAGGGCALHFVSPIAGTASKNIGFTTVTSHTGGILICGYYA